MTYNIYINEELIPVSFGFNIVFKLDETLDNGVIVIKYSKKKIPYKMFDKVRVEIIGEEITVYTLEIAYDNLELSSRNPELYSHTIGLIEPIKYFEKINVGTLTFTQPTVGNGTRYTLLNVLERIRDTYPVETAENIPNTRLFKLSEELVGNLINIKSPEFYFHNTNLKEVLFSVLSYVNAVPRLNELGELFIDYLNEVKNNIDYLKNSVDIMRQQNIELYGTSISSNSENISSDNLTSGVLSYPQFGYGWITPRSTETEFNSLKSLVQLPYKIKRLINVEIKIIMSDGTFNGSIMPFVVEKAEHEGLILSEQATVTSNTLFQNNTLYYNLFGDTIENIGELFTGVYGTHTRRVISNVVSSAKGQEVNYSGNMEDIQFRITFLPLYNDVITAEKTDLSIIDKNSELIDNQIDRVINRESASRNIYGKIERSGNVMLTIQQIHNNISDTLNIGDLTEDNFIITTKKLIFEKDFITGQYTLDKDFNRLSQFIGVDSINRNFAIPNKGTTLARTIIYKDYMAISTEPLNNLVQELGLSSLTQSGFRNYMDTLRGSTSSGILNTNTTYIHSYDNEDGELEYSSFGETFVLTKVIGAGIIFYNYYIIIDSRFKDSAFSLYFHGELKCYGIEGKNNKVETIFRVPTDESDLFYHYNEQHIIHNNTGIAGTVQYSDFFKWIYNVRPYLRYDGLYVIKYSMRRDGGYAEDTQFDTMGIDSIFAQTLSIVPAESDFLVTCNSTGTNNTISLRAPTLDNQLMGKSLIYNHTSGKPYNKGIRYTNHDGYLAKIKLHFGRLSSLDSVKNGQDYPLGISSRITNHVEIDNLEIQKDPREILNLGYNITTIPIPKIGKEIIIGVALSEKNFLIDNRDVLVDTIFLGSTTEVYKKYDNVLVRGDYEEIIGAYISYDYSGKKITLNNFNTTQYQSIVITNKNNALYLAINNNFETVNYIYFQDFHLRPDLDYRFV